ncbi:hypothetical protein [Pseudoxanthomonas sp. J35]|uniref:hypothetical protein n=1 Tax=Pseudoxanthomonas sp. J35 TaxID=935852 RepID=UPI00048B47A7|nr:hypothetical protein [Pseudoxanthomonas sp. J35]
MDISAMSLGHAALLFVLPASLVGAGKLVWHPGEGIERGWIAILFIALCADVALEAVLGKLVI